MNLSLYKITEEFLKLESMLINPETGEINEETESMLDEITRLLSQKTDACVEFIKYLDDQEDLLKKKENELKEFKKKLSKAQERMENLFLTAMKRLEKNEIKGGFYKVKIRGPSKIVNVINQAMIPFEFLRTKIEVDKVAIKDAVKRGETVDGIEIIDGKVSLNIRSIV